MKTIVVAVGLMGSSMLLFPTEANAVVCARGVVRAGCVAAGGAVVVRRPVAVAPRAVVVAPRPVVVAPRAVVVAPRPVVVAPGRAVVRRPVRY